MLRVRISNTDTGKSATLCDSPDPLPRHNLRVNGRPILQLVDLLEAEFGDVIDHGNRRPTISFNATRDKDDNGAQFDDESDAMAWLLDHVCADCPTSGDVELTIGSGAGAGGSFTRYIIGAGIQELGLVEQVGCSLVMGYAIVGGEYRKVNPAVGP